MIAADFRQLFLELHPGFFECGHIRNMPEEELFHEMLLKLDNFDPDIYKRYFMSLYDSSVEISFGTYTGDPILIQKIVGKVDVDWCRYFDGSEPIYCGYVDGKPVSFCMITDYGVHKVGNRNIRIGGPSCVGTLPQYRDLGIGLTMVKNVTNMLKQQGCDYAYVHFTSEPLWYAKLGYRTCLVWNCNGFLNSKNSI